jgi:hypothetical protein
VPPILLDLALGSAKVWLVIGAGIGYLQRSCGLEYYWYGTLINRGGTAEIWEDRVDSFNSILPEVRATNEDRDSTLTNKGTEQA